jgi:hypothetical protein
MINRAGLRSNGKAQGGLLVNWGMALKQAGELIQIGGQAE